MIPTIGITMGDPGGIGPEIICKAITKSRTEGGFRPVVIGYPEVMLEANDLAGTNLLFREISPTDIDGLHNTEIGIIRPSSEDFTFRVGGVDANNGHGAYKSICLAADLALQGILSGICTAPISKESMYLAGYTFPGHTELLAERCGNADVRMMLAGPALHVVLETIHVPLSKVPSLLSSERILKTIEIMHNFGVGYFQRAPRIGVAGLNPHAGEAGHFGNEEIDIIAPAIRSARNQGIDVEGPFPGDTIFYYGLQGKFDLILAMYHDQGLIPVKTLYFDTGVNVTLGLPIVRTSPDHGTAFDIAGQGIARPGSMVSALFFARTMTRRKIGAEG